MTTSALVPLSISALTTLVAYDDPSHRAVALRHAAIHGRPDLWGDHPTHPSFAMLLRDGYNRPEPSDDRFEAFAAGLPETAIGRFEACSDGRPILLAAPAWWDRALSGRVEVGTIRTWRFEADRSRLDSSILVRRLDFTDTGAFKAEAPGWAARAWGGATTLIERGAAFGVPDGLGFAALAWIFETDLRFAKIGVATRDRYRRLGLGRAVASALIEEILAGGRIPLWTAAAENLASAALARSLGFANPVDEALLVWNPA